MQESQWSKASFIPVSTLTVATRKYNNAHGIERGIMRALKDTLVGDWTVILL